MAIADYKKYLAENVLNERRTVTYRSIGRALRVHSTLAKQMLYDFHQTENNKKPNSVNATYIITGVQKSPELTSAANGAQDSFYDNNGIPPSSPYVSSSMPNQDAVTDEIAISSVLLVREEDLEDAKSTFQSISSIHVYSLQPTVLQDLNVLTDVAAEMAASHAQEDPLEYGQSWGMIQGNNVRRRTGGRPPVPAAPPAPPKATIPAKRPIKSEEPTQSKVEPEEKAPKVEETTKREETPASTKPIEKTAPPKQKGSIFSSFAKAKPKQKKEESATPASGVESAEPNGAEDLVLGDASDGDEEPEELFPDSGKSAHIGTRESRKEREEKLRKMMEEEDEDEEMPDTEPSPEESKPIDEPPPKQAELKEEVTVRGGRRRGRRQVMKKKTVKDEEGYLVTVEEPSWESFSEDEPAPPPKKKPAVSAPKAKPAAKPGQGNIMSFFSKK
ncbi:uncharacterized protein BO80DRAFT_422538 [Aspergillus ibericus CBS 121593]|uniref:DNA polymerase delta subunit 3 n=1 Tax=Aspergillus ibericus CBS 121593 TaxID=1448316 RepID=A0A395H970_9EURO|nr:hypothetical protein BO80DRAFT_422538 [Aspergillus ibericus CBS 121593]RAL04176.1 hypothetical protein BO80DRAFT_422538 [Aspergillus ibericus CBS 121593]